MKKLLLLALVLNLCFFLEGQAQSQTALRKRPEFSPHSKRTRFAKPPYSWHKEVEGDSSEMARQNERLRSSLPPHLRGMKNLPPHILAERRWLCYGYGHRWSRQYLRDGIDSIGKQEWIATNGLGVALGIDPTSGDVYVMGSN